MLAALSTACSGTGVQASPSVAWSMQTASKPLGRSTATRAPRARASRRIARVQRATRSATSAQTTPTQTFDSTSKYRYAVAVGVTVTRHANSSDRVRGTDALLIDMLVAGHGPPNADVQR